MGSNFLTAVDEGKRLLQPLGSMGGVTVWATEKQLPDLPTMQHVCLCIYEPRQEVENVHGWKTQMQEPTRRKGRPQWRPCRPSLQISDKGVCLNRGHPINGF